MIRAGLIRSYTQEIKPTPIRTLILQPGSYRTQIRDPGRFKASVPSNTKHHRELYDNIVKFAEATHGTQEGDPKAFCELAWDLVKGVGVAEGKEVPQSLPTGCEAVEYELPRRERELKELREWEGVLRGTDFPGVEKGTSFTEMKI